MYMELKATAKLGELLGMADKKALYEKKAEYLQQAIQEQCWMSGTGFSTMWIPICCPLIKHRSSIQDAPVTGQPYAAH